MYRQEHRIAQTGAKDASTAGPGAARDDPLDPLNLDIDDEEMEYEPDRLNRELEVCAPRFICHSGDSLEHN